MDPIRFLLSHDNKTKEGKYDWVKLSSRSVGILLIYSSMIAGPYFFGQWLIPQASFLPAILLYISSIAFFPLFNVLAHEVYNLASKNFHLAPLNIKIPPLNSATELALSGTGLAEHFAVGQAQSLAKRVNEVLGDPKNSRKLEKWIGEGKNRFQVFLRKNGSPSVWAIGKGDNEKLAAHFSVKVLDFKRNFEIPELDKETELALSGTGLAEHFGVGQARFVAKGLKEDVGDPERSKKLEKTLGEGKNPFKVFLRKNGGPTVWAITKEDLEKFAAYFGQEVREARTIIIPPLDKETELALSGTGLAEHVGAGKAISLAKRINDKLGDPERSKELEKWVGEGENRFQVFLRKNGPKIVWAIGKVDKKKFAVHFDAKVLDFKIPELDKETGLALSPLELAPYFGPGKAKSLVKQVKEELGDPEEASELEKTLGEGENRFKVFLRKNMTRIVWAIAKEDLEKVSVYFGEEVQEARTISIPKFDKENEIALSQLELTPDFGAGKAVSLAKRVKEKLGDPEKATELEKPLGEGENQFKVFLRKNGGPTVWAIAKEDKDKFAVYFGEAVRRDFDEEIDRLDLAEAIALLGKDPLRLQQYIRLYYPELSLAEVDEIVATAIKGLRGDWSDEDKDEFPSQRYPASLPLPTFDKDYAAKKISTDQYFFEISGKANPKKVEYVQVLGMSVRKIKVRQDGTFSAKIPLHIVGGYNELYIYAVNEKTKERSPAIDVDIEQTGTPVDPEEAFLALIGVKEEILERIQKKPGELRFLLWSTELALLKYFTQDEAKGFQHLRGLIQKEKSKAKKKILQTVLAEFEEIVETDYELKRGERLYFFQKYAIYKTRRIKESGEAKGVLNAMEQGLGKTVTALKSVQGEKTVILTPNPVVSAWGEQEEKFFSEVNLTLLEGSYKEREEQLRHLETSQVVTNIEFTQGMTKERARLLSRPEGVLVIDEADYLVNKDSQQSQGTEQIEAEFKILLSATPFKKVSQLGRVLNFLRPKDPRFESAQAFARAFPINDPEAMKAAFLLLQEQMIRIRKRDVFEEYDPAIPLSEQKDKLPRKVEVKPENTETGQFYLTPEQSASILELFTDYQRWCQKHKGKESDEDRSFHKYKEGYFSKKESLRQIMNDPRYIDVNQESPKHLAMDTIVRKELDGEGNSGRKMVIFARYRHEVEAYMERYKEYGARAYYGELRKNSNGYRVDEKKKVLYYEVDRWTDEKGKVRWKYKLDKNYQFLPATRESGGMPIRALDHERILFQNDPKSRIIIASYDSGAVGVTFTAADVVVDDDLAETYRDQYQSDERAHRIDNLRKKDAVKYYRLQALYPEAFLQTLPAEVRKDYFANGTWDQVQYQNLRRQGRIFHRVMDGVGSDEELEAMNTHFMHEKLPFLFANGQLPEEEHEFIAQGEAARKEFYAKLPQIEKKENRVTGKFKHPLIFLLRISKNYFENSPFHTEQLQKIIERISQKDFEVYTFDAIVKGKDDFVLSHYDKKRNRLYLAKDLLAYLSTGETHLSSWLLDELLFHELSCPTFSHYFSIAIQQQFFPENYPDAYQLQKQNFQEPYKGLLGQALRAFIADKLKKKQTRKIPIQKYSPQNRLQDWGIFDLYPLLEQSA